MDKQHILEEINRTASENGGIPLGQDRFYKETGIKVSDWFGKYWSRWGDAVKEAGFAPNKLQGAYEEDHLIKSLIDLIRELRRFPVKGELRMKRRSDPTFPNDKVFRRFGSKSQLVSRILEYCRDHDGFDDVISLCTDTHISKEPERRKTIADTGQIGEGYLLKSGQFYKIGKTNAIGRRERELAIQLPEKSRTVHVIKTDDPAGIEAYWHTRFAAKRKHGEWFELNSEDLAAFKRRKFM